MSHVLNMGHGWKLLMQYIFSSIGTQLNDQCEEDNEDHFN